MESTAVVVLKSGVLIASKPVAKVLSYRLSFVTFMDSDMSNLPMKKSRVPHVNIPLDWDVLHPLPMGLIHTAENPTQMTGN